jgi:hypothetical protein
MNSSPLNYFHPVILLAGTARSARDDRAGAFCVRGPAAIADGNDAAQEHGEVIWCEQNRVDYVFGLARDARLEAGIVDALAGANRHPVGNDGA